eukprot:1260122-Amphidinium_carterae.1
MRASLVISICLACPVLCWLAYKRSWISRGPDNPVEYFTAGDIKVEPSSKTTTAVTGVHEVEPPSETTTSAKVVHEVELLSKTTTKAEPPSETTTEVEPQNETLSSKCPVATHLPRYAPPTELLCKNGKVVTELYLLGAQKGGSTELASDLHTAGFSSAATYCTHAGQGWVRGKHHQKKTKHTKNRTQRPHVQLAVYTMCVHSAGYVQWSQWPLAQDIEQWLK